jgi:hypothetical protein
VSHKISDTTEGSLSFEVGRQMRFGQTVPIVISIWQDENVFSRCVMLQNYWFIRGTCVLINPFKVEMDS